ncbi:MAG TPA: Crp/Fnr family transcriptional regulator [Streptosporangiaceae bacterium]
MDGVTTPKPSSRDIQPLVEVLAETELFRMLDNTSIAAIARAGLVRRYRPGGFVFHQGDPGDRLYVVIDGLVKVVFATEGGDEIVLNALGRASTFGETALLDRAPRSASIVAVERTRLFSLSRGQVIALMREHPALLDGFLHALGRLVRGLTERAADSAFLDLTGRLAKRLLHLASKHGEANGVVLDLGLTQSDLAALIGGSRSAVNRALQRLDSRGLIAMKGRTIVLRDTTGLRRLCGYHDGFSEFTPTGHSRAVRSD